MKEVDLKTRSLVFMAVLALAGAGLVARLVQLQILSGEAFLQEADSNRLRLMFEGAPRGLIRDRHGKILATNRLAYAVSLYPTKESTATLDGVLDKLADILGMDRAELARKAHKLKTTSLPVLIKQDLDPRSIAILAENQDELPGVSLEPITIRYYPRDGFASHLLGYVGEISDAELNEPRYQGLHQGDIVGKDGIEEVLDPMLRGRPGAKQVEVDARNHPVKVLENLPPVPGQDVTLTIDADLQAAAEKALEGKRGAAVAIDPRNGQVLALASEPGFDPNLFAKPIDDKTWKELNGDDHPLLDRAISSAYPPGSIFKFATSIAALEHHIVTATTHFDSTGVFHLGNYTWHDWYSRGFGNVTFTDAFVWSIDTVYYQLGHELGPWPIAHAARDLGLGERTGIILPGEVPGIIPDPRWKEKWYHQPWYPGESINMSIGQGYIQVTPLQAAVMMATVADGGHVWRPKLILPPLPPWIQQLQDPDLHNDWSPDTVAYLRDAAQKVVDSGTGTAAKIPGIAVGGKTGSAETTPGKPTDAWFVCYAPVQHPTIAIAVLVEHAGHGGSHAAPIAHAMLMEYFHVKSPGAKKPDDKKKADAAKKTNDRKDTGLTNVD